MHFKRERKPLNVRTEQISTRKTQLFCYKNNLHDKKRAKNLKITDTGTKEETKETNASNRQLGQFDVVKKQQQKAETK